jgi:chromosome segregation protein
MSTGDPNNLSEIIREKDLTIKKIAGLIKLNEKKYLEEINQLKDSLSKKEEECRGYIEKLKSLERKNDEMYKNVTTGNISDLNELKKQFDKDTLMLNELIKTLKNGINEKNENLQKLTEELNLTKNLLEEEKKKNENLSNINNSKFDPKSTEIQFYKISTENSSLKTKLMNCEEKIEKLFESSEKLKNEKLEIEKSLKNSLDLVKSELNFKNNSYKILLKDYQNTNATLTHSQEELEKSKYFQMKYEKEKLINETKMRNLENEIINYQTESDGLKTRLKSNEIEIENNRKKIKELESRVADIKLSKQIFDVTYFYMRMQIPGRIIMQREGNSFSFSIENRTSTRKYSFLDIEIRKDANDPNKIIIKFIKENSEEEYYSNDVIKIIEIYEDFKKKTIESSDFTTIKKEDKTNTGKKAQIAQEKLKNLFEF